MKRLFTVLSLATSLLCSYERPITSYQLDIQSREALIKEEEFLISRINQLQEQVRYYEAKADRLEEIGDRLEHQGALSSAEIKWNAAREYEEMANRVGEEVSKLQKEKNDINIKLRNFGK